VCGACREIEPEALARLVSWSTPHTLEALAPRLRFRAAMRRADRPADNRKRIAHLEREIENVTLVLGLHTDIVVAGAGFEPATFGL
jgi:hypothetical protein